MKTIKEITGLEMSKFEEYLEEQERSGEDDCYDAYIANLEAYALSLESYIIKEEERGVKTMAKEMVEKATLLEALENLKIEEYSDYDVGYNVGVEHSIGTICDMSEPKFILTRLEYELLKRWNDKMYKYVARDEDGAFYIYKENPSKKEEVCGTLYGHARMMGYFDDLFTFVKWEDEEPFSIEKLLCESEVLESD